MSKQQYQQLLDELEYLNKSSRSSSPFTRVAQEAAPQAQDQNQDLKQEQSHMAASLVKTYGPEVAKWMIPELSVSDGALMNNVFRILTWQTTVGVLSKVIPWFTNLKLQKLIPTLIKFVIGRGKPAVQALAQIVPKAATIASRGAAAVGELTAAGVSASEAGVVARIIAGLGTSAGAASASSIVGVVLVGALIGVSIGSIINVILSATGASQWIDDKLWNTFGDDTQEEQDRTRPQTIRIIQLFRANKQPIPSQEQLQEYVKEYNEIFRGLIEAAKDKKASIRSAQALPKAKKSVEQWREKALEEFAKRHKLTYYPPKAPKAPDAAPIAAPATPGAPEVKKDQAQPEVKPSGKTYTVQSGDTLSSIAKKHNLSGWEDLLKLNPQIKDPNKIYVGWELKLPQGASAPAPQAPAEKKTAPKVEAPKAPEAKQPAPTQQPQTPAAAPEKKKGLDMKQEIADFRQGTKDLKLELDMGEDDEKTQQLSGGLLNQVGKIAQTGNLRAYYLYLKHLSEAGGRSEKVLQSVSQSNPDARLHLGTLVRGYANSKGSEKDFETLKSLEGFFSPTGKKYEKELQALRNLVVSKSRKQ